MAECYINDKQLFLLPFQITLSWINHYNASETSYHVGVVVSSTQFGDGFRVTVIEGNTSGSNTIDGVGFKTYDPTPGTGEGKGGRYHKNILGFGFANGLG